MSSRMDTVYNMTDVRFLSSFQIQNEDLQIFVNAPSTKFQSHRNEHNTSPKRFTLIMRRRLASRYRWMHLVLLFKKHSSRVCEIFWEEMQHFLKEQKHLLLSNLHDGYIFIKAELFSDAIHRKCSIPRQFIGFMDGALLGIARPGNDAEQNAAYNGHKRKHTLKFQTITGPVGIIFHKHRPLEERCHEWPLYIQSKIERQRRDV